VTPRPRVRRYPSPLSFFCKWATHLGRMGRLCKQFAIRHEVGEHWVSGGRISAVVLFTVLRGGRKGKDVDVEAKEKGELGGEMHSFVSARSCTVA
jgi:hypothetical protein